MKDKGMTWEEAAGELGIRALTQKRNLESAVRSYSREESKGAFSKIAEADFQMKTGLLSAEISTTLLVLSLVRKDLVRT